MYLQARYNLFLSTPSLPWHIWFSVSFLCVCCVSACLCVCNQQKVFSQSLRMIYWSLVNFIQSVIFQLFPEPNENKPNQTKCSEYSLFWLLCDALDGNAHKNIYFIVLIPSNMTHMNLKPDLQSFYMSSEISNGIRMAANLNTNTKPQ